MRRNRKFVAKFTTVINWNVNRSGFNWFVLHVDYESGVTEGRKIQQRFVDETGNVDTGQVILVCYMVRNRSLPTAGTIEDLEEEEEEEEKEEEENKKRRKRKEEEEEEKKNNNKKKLFVLRL